MSNEAQITFTGTAGADSELRFTPNGAAVANVSIAVTARVKDGDAWKDGDTAWYRVTVWRDFAEHVGESIRKGDRVTVVGRLAPREFEKDGVKRISLEVDAESVALDLRFRSARAADKTPQPAQSARQSGGDLWATDSQGRRPASTPAYDEPPF